jgi:hypothetical protein
MGFSSLLDDLLETGQRVRPEAVEIGAQGGKPSRVELIYAACSIGVVVDESRTLEHFEVLRHRGSADGQLTRQLPDCARSVRQAFDDRASGAVRHRHPGVIVLVSGHEP